MKTVGSSGLKTKELPRTIQVRFYRRIEKNWSSPLRSSWRRIQRVVGWRSPHDGRLLIFFIFLFSWANHKKMLCFPLNGFPIARSPTMLTGSPVLCRPLLIRMDTHQSLIIRQRWKSAEKTDEVLFHIRNAIEEFCWIESDKLSNKFLFVHIFWLSQVIHKKTRMWCYCQLTILLWRSQQSMYHCGARCKDICLVSCRRRQKNWGI